MMQGDYPYELEMMEADPAGYDGYDRLRAADDMCAGCRAADFCPAAFGGGFCPVEEEMDYQDYKAQVFAAARGR